MIGNMKWNMYTSLAVMMLTILFSLSHNVLLTSLLRGIYAFVSVFIIVFIIRWLLYLIFNIQKDSADAKLIGNHVNLSTPDESEQLLPNYSQSNTPVQPDHEQQFSPLNLERFETKKNIEEVVNVVRHMSED